MRAPVISGETLGPQLLNVTLDTCELDLATCEQTFILNLRTLYLHSTLFPLVVHHQHSFWIPIHYISSHLQFRTSLLTLFPFLPDFFLFFSFSFLGSR